MDYIKTGLIMMIWVNIRLAMDLNCNFKKLTNISII